MTTIQLAVHQLGSLDEKIFAQTNFQVYWDDQSVEIFLNMNQNDDLSVELQLNLDHVPMINFLFCMKLMKVNYAKIVDLYISL